MGQAGQVREADVHLAGAVGAGEFDHFSGCHARVHFLGDGEPEAASAVSLAEFSPAAMMETIFRPAAEMAWNRL